MKLHSSAHGDERIVVVEGAVGTPEVAELRAGLLEAVTGDGGHDVLLDVHGVPSFADEALTALTAARSQGKSLRRRVVVLDDQDGATSRSLRRSGQIFRFPVHPDAVSARAALAADRASVAGTNPVRPPGDRGAEPVRARPGRAGEPR
ncbi:hypothetical protein [Kineococcus rhizosphaerae]|uniref:Anti-anti-sigma factor n=1 Tax=Kineococcus rhizosphaerae TaxID=559628 RepID=A0A2T0R298_9ACTN|nr:hypothetical protein [Kineococcus rhizosphaerae]PRY13883.1 hypothetical protein CLV37_1071 [Kineococcus rhizosphaerae]